MDVLHKTRRSLLAISMAACMMTNALAVSTPNSSTTQLNNEAFSWLHENGITTCPTYSVYRGADPILFDEMVTLFMRTFYSDEWACGILKDDARGWAYEYRETASFIGLFSEAERKSMEIRVTNRDLWRWIGRCSNLCPYPAWCYDGQKPTDDPERDVEFALKSSGLCAESTNPDATPTRGEVAELLYRLETDSYDKPLKPTIMDKIPLQISDTASNQWQVRNSILHGWAVLSEKYQKAFRDKGWNIRILRSLREKSTELSGCIGYTDLETHEIDIGAVSYKTGENIFLHEIGHFISYYSNEPLIKWYMYDAEKEQIAALLGTPYGKQSREELFAEAVRCVLSTPKESSQYEKLKQEIPFSLAIIEEVFLKPSTFYDPDAISRVQEKYWDYLQTHVDWRISTDG